MDIREFIYSLSGKQRVALQHYTDKVCKKQRSNCNDNLFRVERLDWRSAAASILDAEQPKIDDII